MPADAAQRAMLWFCRQRLMFIDSLILLHIDAFFHY
jgi:hypothetical protein